MITEDHNFKYKIGSYTGEVIINTTILLYSIPFLFFFKGDTFNFDSYLPMFLLWGLNTMFTIVYIMLRRYYDKRPLVISLGICQQRCRIILKKIIRLYPGSESLHGELSNA